MQGAEVRFDGRVAIVTGSGGGLGRKYAETLASRGAKVVINDLDMEKAADACKAIKSAGGEALANSDSVTEGGKIVAAAVEAWGRVDILINNAGILKDVAFHRMSAAQFQSVLEVHLMGTFNVTRAAWPHMRTAGYGRIVNITSVNGLYGTFGQANYSSAKAAIIGLTKTLAIEGKSKGIQVKSEEGSLMFLSITCQTHRSTISLQVNAVAPGGGTQMTATVMPPDLLAKWKPEYAVPCIAYLCAENCKSSGNVFEAGGGWMAQVRWQRSPGVFFKLGEFTIEDVSAAWDKVTDFSDATAPEEEGSIGPNSPQLAQILHGSKL
ncbi:MAG: hypothetical protein SGPRY_011943 [Prymnesium sp.]